MNEHGRLIITDDLGEEKEMMVFRNTKYEIEGKFYYLLFDEKDPDSYYPVIVKDGENLEVVEDENELEMLEEVLPVIIGETDEEEE